MDENLSGMDKEEEAYFHLTVNDFTELVDKYGFDFIFKQCPKLSIAYYKWFYEDSDDDIWEYIEKDYTDAGEN